MLDRAGDGLGGVDEGRSCGSCLADEAAVEALDDAVHGAEQDAALAEDVGLVLGLERGLEGVRRADRDRPAERVVGGPAVDVLLDGEAGVDAGAVDLARPARTSAAPTGPCPSGRRRSR